jgi:hypothetical protein
MAARLDEQVAEERVAGCVGWAVEDEHVLVLPDERAAREGTLAVVLRADGAVLTGTIHLSAASWQLREASNHCCGSTFGPQQTAQPCAIKYRT